MSLPQAVLLLVAGIAGGLSGSIAGLASLATYPALLSMGLPPVTANVTNTVALVFSSIGSVSGSRPELVGQGRRLRPLAVAGATGAVIGAALLLVTPGEAFELVVPWLIGLASVAILVRRPLIAVAVADAHADVRLGAASHVPRNLLIGVGVIGIYAGYFGAGAGVMLLALFLFMTGEVVARANAAKNLVLGVSNGIAAVGLAIFGDVRWPYAAPLALGLLIGGRLGPVVVRRLPDGPLRVGIALAGVGLALKLGSDAYR
ncbi:MAG: sulfite exporter TauE/SafE family protein [Ilumatobacteraceae bacterium]